MSPVDSSQHPLGASLKRRWQPFQITHSRSRGRICWTMLWRSGLAFWDWIHKHRPVASDSAHGYHGWTLWSQCKCQERQVEVNCDCQTEPDSFWGWSIGMKKLATNQIMSRSQKETCGPISARFKMMGWLPLGPAVSCLAATMPG